MSLGAANPWDALLDQIAMSHMGSSGSTQAHHFLQDRLGSPLRNAESVIYRVRHGARVFVSNKAEDRIVMFSDNSGVYVHADGFCTPLGSDISHEATAWTEVK